MELLIRNLEDIEIKLVYNMYEKKELMKLISSITSRDTARRLRGVEVIKRVLKRSSDSPKIRKKMLELLEIELLVWMSKSRWKEVIKIAEVKLKYIDTKNVGERAGIFL